METPKSRSVLFSLADCVGPQCAAADTAQRLAHLWRDIDARLAPLIGNAGLTGLYQRSLYLAAREHASLAGLFTGGAERVEMSVLTNAIAAQSDHDAATAARIFLLTFQNLLTQLVGAAITTRLLCSANLPPLDDNVVPDPLT